MRPLYRCNPIAGWLLAALLLFGGCALPKGELSGDQRAPDAGLRDAGSERADAAPRASASGAAGKGGGGSAARVADAGVARPAETRAPAKPKANGDPCATSAECASENCKTGPHFGKRCYGGVALGRICKGEFDCDGHACVPRRYGETQGVCVDSSACARDSCQRSHAIAFCQLDQACSAAPMDFVRCFQYKCAAIADTDAGCAEDSVEQRLNELGCCPPNGAGTGSCSVSEQCGCADDQKCDSTRDGRGHAACGPIGSAPKGGACLEDSECPKGFTCRGKLCKRYCDGFDDQSCEKGACVSGAPNGIPEPGIFICSTSCDPTAPTFPSSQFVGCGAGQTCEPSEDGNSGCARTTGTGMQGTPCPDEPNESGAFKCAPGYACLIRSEICARYCRVQESDCDAGTTCYAMDPKNYAGGIEIGFCK